MANELAPMIMVKYKPEFTEIDYSTYLNSPYDITVPLQAIQQEAGAKGMGVIVQVALVPLSTLMGDDENNQNPPENQDLEAGNPENQE